VIAVTDHRRARGNAVQSDCVQPPLIGLPSLSAPPSLHALRRPASWRRSRKSHGKSHYSIPAPTPSHTRHPSQHRRESPFGHRHRSTYRQDHLPLLNTFLCKRDMVIPFVTTTSQGRLIVLSRRSITIRQLKIQPQKGMTTCIN